MPVPRILNNNTFTGPALFVNGTDKVYNTRVVGSRKKMQIRSCSPGAGFGRSNGDEIQTLLYCELRNSFTTEVFWSGELPAYYDSVCKVRRVKVSRQGERTMQNSALKRNQNEITGFSDNP